MRDDKTVNNGCDDGGDDNCLIFVWPTIPEQKRLRSTTAWKRRAFFIVPISDQVPVVSSYWSTCTWRDVTFVVDQIHTYLRSGVTAIDTSAVDYNMLRQSSRSQATQKPGKTLCDLFKTLHNASLLMQYIKMLIEKVMMDSFGQTFIQLINIRHCTMYRVWKTTLTIIRPRSDKIVLMIWKVDRWNTIQTGLQI